MNGLSLRVSSIRTTHNLKKNSEIQISILKLSDNYLNRVSDYFVNEPDVHSCLNEFRDGKSVEQQLVSARTLLTQLENELPSRELRQGILDLLSEIYFTAPLKHSLRKIIARSFDKMKVERSSIVESLVQTVARNLNEIDDSVSVEALNNAIVSVDGFTENFEIGALALHRCFDDVFHILMMCVGKYLLEIEKPNSPANLSEIFIFLHNSIKLLLWYIQRCVSDLSLAKTSQLAQISKFCEKIIDCDVVPMDTKLNCGILLVLKDVVNDNLQELYDRLIAEKASRIDELMLCYCYGLCNTLASSNIFNERGSFLIEIVEMLRTIADENINEQTMLLGACRALLQMTKSFSTLSCSGLHETNTKTACMTDLVPLCLSFVWSFIEHHLNTVRHFCKDILRNLLKLSHKHDDSCTFILPTVLSTIMRQEMDRKVQYTAVECLCHEMQIESILQSWPSILEDLFEDLDDRHCAACYRKMMSIHCKEVNVESWFQLWIHPLLGNFAKNVSLQTKEYLVSVAIKTHPMVPGYFLQEKDKLPLELYLFVVSIIRSSGLHLGFHFVPADDKRICDAKFHNTDDIRIMHLRIFVEVQKTTHPFTAADLNEILEFLRYNSNCQSPAFRQKIISIMTKAFNRIEASYPSVVRDPSKMAHDVYIQFLTKMKHLCLSNICSGANFSRRLISLNLLLQTLTVSSKNDKIPPKQLWTKELFDKMVKSLNDTYEANKVLAVNIIRLCPRTLVPKSEKFDLSYLKDLVTSVKPIDCVTAAYSLEYCCITGINFSSYLEAIIWCKEILTDGLKVAQSSLLIAARTNPLYGLVFCIKHLMNRVDLMKTYDQNWRNFVQKLIELCKSLTEVVGPIVNNSSPEGHLPNDFSDVNNFLPNETDAVGEPDKILSSRSRQNDNSECLSTTPQMLLLCSWRTVKEVSLLLGNLALNTATVGDSNQGVITIDEILEIGNHFHILLSETKHRGAFEQAFVGFSKLCVRLWRANEARLHQLPMVWLKDLLIIISGNDSSSVMDLKFDKICATRRSAGVPFMIQAILTSELQVCTSRGLKCSMVSLIDICRNGSVIEGRTHALNILRALFRCTDLGDSVGEYISDGIECAIRGYSADNWSVRNSSTLLFSSLITRVFGVQRTKDSENLNIRNKMTGRIFFLKYPRLFDFFFLELQAASQSIQEDEVPPTLHPLLILLSRLYPSAVDGCTSNLKLSLFLPLIGQCSFSPELETRKLAVKSIVALVPKYELYDYVHRIVHQLLQRDVITNMNSNAMHGSLLQIYHLIKSVDPKLFTKHFENFVSLTQTYLNLNVFNCNNFVIIKVYADTIIEIFTRIGSKNILKDELTTSLHTINEFISSIFTNPYNAIGFPLAIKSSVVLHLMVNVTQIESLNFLQNLPSRPYEYVDTALNIILLVLHHTCPDDIFDRFECDRNEQQFLHYLTFDEKRSLRQAIIESKELVSHLNDIIDDEKMFYPFCTVKAYTVLSELKLDAVSEDELVDVLERRTIDQIDEVKASIVTYVGNHFGTMTEENLVRTLRKFRETAAPDGSEELRWSTSLIVSKMNIKCSSSTSLLLFGDIILLLLRDESSEIRETISRVVQCLRCDQAGCEAVVLPSLAEEQFIDWLDEQFAHLNIENPSTIWMQLIQIQMDKSPTENEDIADEVFDKCESNVFGEEVLLCKKLMKKWQESLRNLDAEDVKEMLRSSQSEWPELFECGDFL